ncbi:MAG TPA: methyl-accepting chemotaxis protein [Steroidobacteraceae bacterium]|nr:methyl-accepting chemotaxis protein [Steroidobacteraceae bacterium]
MRLNMPVTQREVELKDGETIVSKTDLKGVITYCNRTFQEISGFSESELMGKAHNIVRHPDMPPAAFQDLWNTLKAGRPWSGMIKNRCKNGDHYWVYAETSPVVEGGAVTGYLSVRFKADRSAVDAASKLYKSMNEGTAGRIAIRGGKVVRTGWIAAAQRGLTDSSIKRRLVLLIGMLSVLLAAVGGVGLYGMKKGNEALLAVYEDRAIPMGEIANIQRLLLRNRLLLATALVTPEPEVIRDNTAEMEQNIAAISKLWATYMGTSLGSEERKLAEAFAADRAKFVQQGLVPAIAALRRGDTKGANGTALNAVRPLYVPVGEGIDALMQWQLHAAKLEYDGSMRRYETTRNLSVAAILLGILTACALGYLMISAIMRGLSRAAAIADSVSHGDLAVKVGHSPNDEFGKLVDALRVMMQALKGFESAQSDIARRHDAGQTSFTVPPEQFQGSYAKMAERVNALAQSHIAIQMKLADVMKHYAVGDFSVDMEDLPGEKKVITEACAEAKRNLMAMKDQIAALSAAASKGDFSKRGDAKQFDHAYREMVSSLNLLMETADVGLGEVVRVLGALAQGDLTERITNEYQGTFGRLKDDSNTTVNRLTEIVGQIKESTESINVASSEIAAGNTNLSQRTEEQAASLEETAASMEELTTTVKQNADNAQQANKLAAGASEVAIKGGAVVGQVVTTMRSINESSKKIVDIIGVIDSIAFQTNILALNAAVEAARAGEGGRGFAVVASEVRNLAMRSSSAAKEIRDLISDSVEKVGEGTRLVDEAGRTMEEIVGSVKRVTDIMADISGASQQQSSGIEQVNIAITQMDDVTQQNAALVEQAAAAAESMEEQARNLAHAVAVFKLTGTNGYGAGKPLDGSEPVNRRANVSQLPKRDKAPARPPLSRARTASASRV